MTTVKIPGEAGYLWPCHSKISCLYKAFCWPPHEIYPIFFASIAFFVACLVYVYTDPTRKVENSGIANSEYDVGVPDWIQNGSIHLFWPVLEGSGCFLLAPPCCFYTIHGCHTSGKKYQNCYHISAPNTNTTRGPSHVPLWLGSSRKKNEVRIH